MRGGHRLTLSSTGALCRDAHLRSDDAWLRAARTRGAYLAVTTRAQVLVAGAQQPRLLTHADVGAGADGSTFLGHMHGTPLFAIAWGSLAPLTRTRLEEERDTKLVGLRTVLGTMDAGAINAAAMATGLAAWDAASRHCGVCGAATLVREAGHRKDCTDAACQTKHFPRTDAAVIMLVSDAAGEHCILGRQAAWEPGRYSTLAGFVEPGESLEDAVAREVLEEVGVVVRNVRYAASQPWPFPASLMVAFHCVADAGAVVRPNADELEHARWFSRDEIAQGRALSLPHPAASSSFLVQQWLARSHD